MNVTLKFTSKNVYGRVLAYPMCEKGRELASAFKVKTFNLEQISAFRGAGIVVVLIAEPLTPEAEDPPTACSARNCSKPRVGGGHFCEEHT